MSDSLAFLPFTKPSIDEETIAAVTEVLRSGWLASGPKVQALEAQLSEYFGGRPVRTFNSGTCTMEIALRIAGIGAGDEVITTPNSWVATASVIIETGATPVFVDIDPKTHNIDLNRVEAAITPRTKAIIPVHMCGLPCDMDKLMSLPTNIICAWSKMQRSHRLDLERETHRFVWRFCVVQLSGQQKYHDRRRWLPGIE
jgi:dTDP-4-amino-4,6-dideoxygalactose transaminase